MTNLGKWERWYAMVTDPEPYGNSPTYAMGAEWLDGLEIEDWGCGKGWMRNFVDEALYTGIDGSASPFADAVVDLVHYDSNVEGIFMRHVLEHDWRWFYILGNALRSFTKRMFLVLFTPTSDVTHEIAWNEDPGVPDISFSIADITHICSLYDVAVTVEAIDSPSTQYGCETIFRMEKR